MVPRLTSPSAFDSKPEHWLRFEKDKWRWRTRNPLRDDHLREIVRLAYSILTRKIAGRSVTVDNEASFQLHLGSILKTLGDLYQFSERDLFSIELETYIPLNDISAKSTGKRARADIVLALGTEQIFSTCAIELKFFKRGNHREPNNRYDVFAELLNLEQYKRANVDVAYLIVGTDNPHYVMQNQYSADTADFDLRNGVRYNSGKVLEYKTSKPYGTPIVLQGNYTFSWDSIPIHGKAIDEIHFLCLEV